MLVLCVWVLGCLVFCSWYRIVNWLVFVSWLNVVDVVGFVVSVVVRLLGILMVLVLL